MLVCFDIKFMRLDQNHVGLARQASPFLRFLCSRYQMTHGILYISSALHTKRERVKKKRHRNQYKPSEKPGKFIITEENEVDLAQMTQKC